MSFFIKIKKKITFLQCVDKTLTHYTIFSSKNYFFLFPEVYWHLGSIPLKNVIFDGFKPRGTVLLGQLTVARLHRRMLSH